MPYDCPTSYPINKLVCSYHRSPTLSNFVDEEIYMENKTDLLLPLLQQRFRTVIMERHSSGKYKSDLLMNQ
ncbi:hypothetical protein OPV22_027948 [Ensete ventricosum]|uniref:Uncharacterized protein n=1 Tax=Ensete ventricosum TaxID=4639 RepID=A0AAV8Q766_ENSVE|nr:hypothetical protein OPV22_027948 [Ensete ventricosum]